MRLLFAIFLLFPLLACSISLSATTPKNEGKVRVLKLSSERPDTSEHEHFLKIRPLGSDSVEIPHSRPKRGVAIALTILLGPLGGHRLYLGTDPKVPVLYTVTLGGGLGLLPLIDLVQLIVTKDFEKFFNKGKVFMWIEEKEE